MPETSEIELKVQVVPVVGDILPIRLLYNNQLMQTTTAIKMFFVPILNAADATMFALSVDNNLLAPAFIKGDILIVSPEVWTRSGDIAAVEYGNDVAVKAIMQVTF